MDLSYLEKTLRKIELKSQMIKGISEYCILNSRGCENEVAKIIDEEYQTHVIEQKLAILEVISEIFIMTGTKGETRFLKLIGGRVKNYIEDISRRVGDIKPEFIHIVPQILENWTTTVIIAPTYMEKLKKIASPVVLAAKKIDEEKKNGMFGNYSKAFLLEYEEIKAFDITSRAYDDFVQFDKISQQIGLINQEMKKISLETVTPEVRERAKELERTLRKFVDKLQDIICNVHVDIKILRGACKEELQKLPIQAKKIYQDSKH